MEVKTLIENLTDSGCSAEGTKRAKALYEAGDMDGGYHRIRGICHYIMTKEGQGIL